MSTTSDQLARQRDLVAWFEIPAVNFDRAVQFYRNGLALQVQVVLFNGVRHGILHSRFSVPRGAIVESSEASCGAGTVIFFRSQYDISSTLEHAAIAGGKIVMPKTLIKDEVAVGASRIPFTLIDNNIGYMAKLLDTEGNMIAVYGNT